MAARLNSLLNYPVIDRFLCGPSTFDLRKALDDKKIIVFNLSAADLGDDGTRLIGQFMAATIQAYAAYRSSPANAQTKPNHAYYLFADEAHYFTSETTPKVMREARKFGLHWVLATQQIDDIDRTIREALINNLGQFLIGRCRGATATTLCGAINIPPTSVSAIPTGHFYLHEQVGPRYKPRMPRRIVSPRIEDEYAVTDDRWGLELAKQYRTYYRPLDAGSAQQPTATPPDRRDLEDHRKPRSRPSPARLCELVDQHAPPPDER